MCFVMTSADVCGHLVDNDDDQAMLVVQVVKTSTYGCIPAGILISMLLHLDPATSAGL